MVILTSGFQQHLIVRAKIRAKCAGSIRFCRELVSADTSAGNALTGYGVWRWCRKIVIRRYALAGVCRGAVSASALRSRYIAASKDWSDDGVRVGAFAHARDVGAGGGTGHFGGKKNSRRCDLSRRRRRRYLAVGTVASGLAPKG